MYPFRLIPPVLLAALAGCASGEAMVASAPAAPAPEVAAPADTVPAAPPVEPDAPLEERWAAPFAVQSVGQLAARDPRPAVVRLETADSAAKPARPDTVPLDAVRVDTASAGAPTAPRRGADSTRTATRPSRPATGGAAPAGRGGRRSHEVKPGETFYAVARKYDVTPAALRAANPGVDPEALRSGTTLWIPGAAAPPSSTTTRTAESRGAGGASRTSAGSSGSRTAGGSSGTGASSTAGRRTHKVVRGDTLFGIARKYGVSAAAIRSANKLEDDNVKLGTTLVIPAS